MAITESPSFPPLDLHDRSDYWVSDGRSIKTARAGPVAVVEFTSGAFNHLDVELLGALAACIESLDGDPIVRSIVLASSGTAFSAGANFQRGGQYSESHLRDFYEQAMRLFEFRKPVIAAIHGAAVGAGLGLALAADFRVCSPEARFSANFNRLGLHPGFGLTSTLPRLIGRQRAALMFYTGRRLGGEEACRMGLVDLVVPAADVRQAALALAQEVAESAPLAVESTKATLQQGFAEDVRSANDHELSCQAAHIRTADFAEGVSAMASRRTPVFLRR